MNKLIIWDLKLIFPLKETIVISGTEVHSSPLQKKPSYHINITNNDIKANICPILFSKILHKWSFIFIMVLQGL